MMNMRNTYTLNYRQRDPIRALQTVHVHWFSGFI